MTGVKSRYFRTTICLKKCRYFRIEFDGRGILVFLDNYFFESFICPKKNTTPLKIPTPTPAHDHLLGCGTKAKREQSVVLPDRRIIDWVRWAVELSEPGGRLFPYSYDIYRKLLKRVESHLGLTVGWTPHSARAGFASEAIARGTPFNEVREQGRWRALIKYLFPNFLISAKLRHRHVAE